MKFELLLKTRMNGVIVLSYGHRNWHAIQALICARRPKQAVPAENCFQAQKKKKVQKITWRCLKNNESITPGLMVDQKSHMSHVYTSHRNSARASLNGCIFLTLHQKLYLRKVLFSSLYCLSVGTLKINLNMYSRSWRSYLISEYWPTQISLWSVISYVYIFSNWHVHICLAHVRLCLTCKNGFLQSILGQVLCTCVIIPLYCH